MIRWSIPLIALISCGQPDSPLVYNGVNASVQLVNITSYGEHIYADTTHRVDHFDLAIHEFSFSGVGPIEPVSLSNGTEVNTDLVDTIAVVNGLTLSTGPWTEVEVSLKTGPVEISGSIDGIPYTLRLPEDLNLSAQRDTFTLADGADVQLRFDLQPHLLWTDISPQSLTLTDQTLLIDSEHNAEFIDVFSQNLLDGLWVRFPGEDDAPAYTPSIDVPQAEAVASGISDLAGQPNPGSGPVSWSINASVWGEEKWVGTTRLFDSAYSVTLAGANGHPLSGASVQMRSVHFGAVQLSELSDFPGVYWANAFGYGRTITLSISHGQRQFQATAVGPEVHQLNPLDQPLDRAVENTLSWSPFEDGLSAQLLTEGGSTLITNDEGHVVIPANTLAYELGVYGEEAFELRRFRTLELLPDRSLFTVGVSTESTLIDVVDSRRGSISGQLGLDSDRDLDGLTGWISASPSASNGLARHWLQLDVPAETDEWRLDGLAPGQWMITYYIDENESDVDFPSGPDAREAAVSHEVWLDPDDALTLDLQLNVH